MTYILLQVANPNSPPATAVLAVAAFTLGTQERRFFDFLYEVAKLVLAVPQDRAQVRAPAPTPPPEPSMAASPRRLSTLTALPASSGLLLGSGGGSVIPEHVGPGEASASANGFSIADHGGKVLLRVQVQLLFWGTAWTAQPVPPVSDITDAVASILSGPYMSGLSQYRGVGVGRLGGAAVVDSSDPPNPFTDRDIAHLVRSQIRAGKVAEPESDPGLMYCVMLPPGVRATDSRIIGEHSYFFFWDLSPPLDVDASLAHYAWITNDGSLDYVTSVFSHELVESCTDPEGTAFTSASGCPGTGWCEIGDVCFTSRSLDGVNVQSYSSEKDHACVIPGVPALTAQ